MPVYDTWVYLSWAIKPLIYEKLELQNLCHNQLRIGIRKPKSQQNQYAVGTSNNNGVVWYPYLLIVSSGSCPQAPQLFLHLQVLLYIPGPGLYLSLLIPSLVLSSQAGASCGPFAFPFGFDTGQLLHQISILCLKKKIIFLALRYSQQNIILNTALKYKQYLGQVKKSRGFYNLSPNMASIISFYPATHLQNYPILSLSRNNSRS